MSNLKGQITITVGQGSSLLNEELTDSKLVKHVMSDWERHCREAKALNDRILAASRKEALQGRSFRPDPITHTEVAADPFNALAPRNAPAADDTTIYPVVDSWFSPRWGGIR